MYLSGTIITALFIGYSARLIKQHKGKTPETLILGIGSLLEGVWLLVSGLVLYYANFIPIVKAIPTAYVVYSVFGWLYGFYLLRDQAETIHDVEDIIMPQAYLNYSLAFATVVTLTAIGLIAGLWYSGYVTF